MNPKPLAISVGDPGGVGPEVALIAAGTQCANDRVAIFGDVDWLEARARASGIERARVVRVDDMDSIAALRTGQLALVQAGESWSREALAHEATRAGGRAQLAALDAAIAAAATQRVRAIVTAPMSKHAVNLAGHAFVGHTEHLAHAAGLPDDAVTMMFLGPRLRVALVTTHLAVAELPAAITRPRVLRTIEHLADALLRLGLRDPPRLAVTGLNPHAGEGGLFGDEELRVIAPAIEIARAKRPFANGRASLHGPIGAETALRQAAAGELEGVIAMTHDQATIASKLLDWTLAVNVTWGLPFVRTSVDHGVAYDAAAAGRADVRGMISALAMAQSLTQTK